LQRGLLGHRICLIAQGKQVDFRHIETLSDWMDQKISIGQGRAWPDTEVLVRNGFDVVQSDSYTTLFDSLIQGKFDCFLRSVGEVAKEQELYKSKGIQYENGLIFIYPEPAFFFLNKQQTALASRIELGLLRAIDDGSYQALFKKLYFI